jgi:hypothetical protein
MIRYFDCPLRIPWLESPTLGSDPTTPSVKSRKSMGIHDPLRSNLSRGGRENLVKVPTVEPYCSWTNAKRVWIKIALIRIALPQWAYSYVVGRRTWAETWADPR